MSTDEFIEVCAGCGHESCVCPSLDERPDPLPHELRGETTRLVRKPQPDLEDEA